MTTTPEDNPLRREEDALEVGEIHQDAEGRRTGALEAGAEHADSEADRNAEQLERSEVGPGVPED